jgi:hypothetical protein
MSRLRTPLLVCLVLLLACGAQGQILMYAILTGAAENPPALNPTTTTGAPRPLASGFATFILNAAQTELSMTATIFNIDVTGAQTADTNDNLVAAHIHAPITLPTQNAGVRWGFFGVPDNDNNPDDLVVTPFASGVGGTFTSKWDQPEGNAGTNLTLQLDNLLNRRAYINFHTVQFGGGEIRGTIVAVPEPSSVAFLGAGAAGLLGLGWRKRRMRGTRS